jgi:hypothetical protein
MTSEVTVLYCENHPQIETTLRCNRCEKPICARCAVLSPTGYRCKQCVQGIQKTFDTTEWYDYPLVFLLAAGLAFLGSQLVPFMRFFTIFVAPIAGVAIAEAVRFAIRRRRSRRIYKVSTIATALGSLIPVLFTLLAVLLLLAQGRSIGLGVLFPLLWQGIYTFIVTSTVYYRLGGIRI